MDGERPVDAGPEAGGGDEHRSAFRTDLAEAMHGAARARHGRLVSDADERQAAYLGALHARAASEVDGLRAANEQEAQAVETWATGELERLNAERDHRLAAARGELQQRLAAHEAHLQGEITRVEEAVRGYRAALDAFFARLDTEVDPARIAELAARVPLLGPLDEIGARNEAPDAEPAAAAEPATATAVEEEVRAAVEAELEPERAAEPEAAAVPEAATVPEAAAVFDAEPEVEELVPEAGIAAAWTPEAEASDPAEEPVPARRLAWWEVPGTVASAGAEVDAEATEATEAAEADTHAAPDDTSDDAPRPTNSAERVRARLHFIAEHRAALAAADVAAHAAVSGSRG